MKVLRVIPGLVYSCSEREWVLLWFGEDVLPFYIHRKRMCYNSMTGEYLEESANKVGYSIEQPTLVLTQVIGEIEVISNDGYWKYYLNWR